MPVIMMTIIVLRYPAYNAKTGRIRMNPPIIPFTNESTVSTGESVCLYYSCSMDNI